MKSEYPWLDILTDCVLNLSEIRVHKSSPRAWLDEVATAIADDLGQGIGIALVRAIPGPPETPWSQSFHAVRCGGAERSAEFRSRYTSSVIAAGLQPDDFILSNPSGFECLMSEDLHHHDKIERLSSIMTQRYGISHFVHCWRSIPEGENITQGALVLDAWQDRDEQPTQPVFPPKSVFRNLMRAISLHLVQIEQQHHTQNEGTLLNQLTPSQRQVAELLLQGKSEKQVASDLERSPHTVHQHVKAIYTRLSVRSRAEFMARCIPVVTIPQRTLNPVR